MSILDALLLGIIQGLTEFFPVSSSGHLKIVEHLLGLENLEQYILFDLLCHVGTLTAILCVFRKDIIHLLKSDWSRVSLVAIATLPLFPLVFALSPIKELFEIPQGVGYGLLFTGALLLIGERYADRFTLPNTESNWRSALLIGVFQAIAVIPGVSRSGSTISAARLLGWNRMEAARFSFLMAIPAILGGVVLETLQIVTGKATVAESALSPYVFGFLASFVVGWFALVQLLKIIDKGRLSIFVWYCMTLGLGWLLYLQVA